MKRINKIELVEDILDGYSELMDILMQKWGYKITGDQMRLLLLHHISTYVLKKTYKSIDKQIDIKNKG